MELIALDMSGVGDMSCTHLDVALAGSSTQTCAFVFNKTLATWPRGAALQHLASLGWERVGWFTPWPRWRRSEACGLGPVCPRPCWQALPETWHCSRLATPCSHASASLKGQKAADSLVPAAFPIQGHVRAGLCQCHGESLPAGAGAGG